MTREDFETHKSGTHKALNLHTANRRTVLNFAAQIMDRATTLKNQPPGQRHAHADEIIRTAREIRNVLLDEERHENPD